MSENNMLENIVEFKGQIMRIIPEILVEELLPMSTADIMELRLKDEKYRGQVINTSDFCYSEDGRRKNYLVLTTVDEKTLSDVGEKILEKIHPLAFSELDMFQEAKLREESTDCKSFFPIRRDTFSSNYKKQNGVFPIDFESISTRSEGYLKKDMLNNKLYRILARHPDEVPAKLAKDETLLKEYVRLVELTRKNTMNMGFDYEPFNGFSGNDGFSAYGTISNFRINDIESDEWLMLNSSYGLKDKGLMLCYGKRASDEYFKK
jgi:hypothetical protein